MVLEAFAMTLRNLLGVPLGAALRKNYGIGPGTSSSQYSSGMGVISIDDNEYVQTIIDITVDDICIGDEPLSINQNSDTPDDVQKKLKDICKEFNSIVKWVAKDLCYPGYSIYDVSVSKTNKLIVIPYLEPVEFYLTKDKEILLYSLTEQGMKRKPLKDKLVFINFDKNSLRSIEDNKDLSSKIAYQITPSPMQLKNAESTLAGLRNAENSIAKARTQLGRIARWVNVDVGASSGDTQKNVVDEISSAINANSAGLTSATYLEFDDNLPVIPNRNGKGKPELEHDVVDVNIRELKDLDYWVGKLNLVMRFPATYMNFSEALDSTAVSLIRGDIRYNKLCSAIRTKIVSTLNDYISLSKFKKWNPVFSLTQLPSSEDDDVMQALDNYTDISRDVEEFVMGDSEDSRELRLHRLELLQDILNSSTNSPYIQKWFEDFRKFVKEFGGSVEGSEAPGGMGMGSPDMDFDIETGSEPSGPEPESEPELEETTEVPESTESDIEFIEPQS